jgi:hypothetical protein
MKLTVNFVHTHTAYLGHGNVHSAHEHDEREDKLEEGHEGEALHLTTCHVGFKIQFSLYLTSFTRLYVGTVSVKGSVRFWLRSGL